MSTFSTTAFSDGGKAIAMSVAVGLALAFLPIAFVIAIPVVPIPIAYVTYRHGAAVGVVSSFVTGAACMAITAPLLGPLAGLLVFLLAAVVGMGAGLGLKLKLSQFNLFLAVSLMFLVSLGAWAAVLLLNMGVGPVAAMEAASDRAAEPARDIYSALGLDDEEIEQRLSESRDFAMTLPYLMPAALLVISLGLSGATVAVARRVFERLRQPFPADFRFRDLRLHFMFAYFMIIGLVCELSAPYIPEAYTSPVSLTGMNLLVVSQVLFFIQGIAIAHFFLGLYRVSTLKRVGVYACMALLQMTFSLISWLGLFDTWIDYRERFARNEIKDQDNNSTDKREET